MQSPSWNSPAERHKDGKGKNVDRREVREEGIGLDSFNRFDHSLKKVLKSKSVSRLDHKRRRQEQAEFSFTSCWAFWLIAANLFERMAMSIVIRSTLHSALRYYELIITGFWSVRRDIRIRNEHDGAKDRMKGFARRETFIDGLAKSISCTA